jgi:hypothetical protein
MAGQNLSASLGVPDPFTGIPGGHHGMVDAAIGQPGHIYNGLMQSPMSPQSTSYALARGAFGNE